jgi:hypothetical protein
VEGTNTIREITRLWRKCLTLNMYALLHQHGDLFLKASADFFYGNMGKNLSRVESRLCSPTILIGMAFSVLICDGMLDDEKKTYAGMRPVPRSIYDIRGRPDADLWMNACDKEVTKLLEMGTFEIVNTEDIPTGNRVMDGHVCLFQNQTG